MVVEEESAFVTGDDASSVEGEFSDIGERKLQKNENSEQAFSCSFSKLRLSHWLFPTGISNPARGYKVNHFFLKPGSLLLRFFITLFSR